LYVTAKDFVGKVYTKICGKKHDSINNGKVWHYQKFTQ